MVQEDFGEAILDNVWYLLSLSHSIFPIRRSGDFVTRLPVEVLFWENSNGTGITRWTMQAVEGGLKLLIRFGQDLLRDKREMVATHK